MFGGSNFYLYLYYVLKCNCLMDQHQKSKNTYGLKTSNKNNFKIIGKKFF